MDIKEAIDELYKVFKDEEEILFSILINNELKLDEVRVNAIIKEEKDMSDLKDNDSFYIRGTEIIKNANKINESKKKVLCTYDT